MAVVNPEVPQWLQPPSESERRRLELLEQQVAAKASSMLRKNVGMARMKEQAARLVQQGIMDEPTARKKALLDNADLIFADEPEALARITQSDQAQAIQARSQASLERWREMQLEEERAARVERGIDTRLWREDQVARWEADRASRESVQEENRKSREEIQQANLELRNKMDAENRALRAQIASEKDETLKSLLEQLSDAKLNLTAAQQRVGKWIRGTSKEELAAAEKAVSDVEESISKRRAELKREFGIDDKSESKPEAPKGKTFRYDPITRRLVPR